jgi:hydrogenase small subunit
MPENKDLMKYLVHRGVSRRSFLKFCGASAAMLGLSDAFVPKIAEAVVKATQRPPVVWLKFQECTGCTESFIKATNPSPAQIILDIISLDFHETIMAAAGDQAEEALTEAVKHGNYIAVVEGSVPTKIPHAMFVRNKTALQIAEEVCKKAIATICVGNCSSFGNVQAANPNPTGAKGIGEALNIPTINLSTCPVNPEWVTTTILHYLVLKKLPKLDAYGRPVMFFGQTIHDNCPRRAHFDEGRYVEVIGTDAERERYCLYKLGCKGPKTFSDCPRVLWNDKISWCIGSGGLCIGCAEKGFWDQFANFYEPLPDVEIPGIRGIKADANTVGVGLAAVTAGGIAVHLGAKAIKKSRQGKTEETEKKDSEK